MRVIVWGSGENLVGCNYVKSKGGVQGRSMSQQTPSLPANLGFPVSVPSSGTEGVIQGQKGTKLPSAID